MSKKTKITREEKKQQRLQRRPSETDREVRRFLLGQYARGEDQRIHVTEPGPMFAIHDGTREGAEVVFVFGISRRTKQFALPWKGTPGQIRRKLDDVLAHLGKVAVLETQPQASAGILSFAITRPVMLILTVENDILTAEACTGRGPSGWISQAAALRKLQRKLEGE